MQQTIVHACPGPAAAAAAAAALEQLGAAFSKKELLGTPVQQQ